MKIIKQEGVVSPLVVLGAIVLILVGVWFWQVKDSLNLTPNTSQNQPVVNLTTADPAGTVTITSAGFNPSTIEAKVGQRIKWINNDTKPHILTSSGGDFDNVDALAVGSSMSISFDQVGTVIYHDATNSALVGTVKVSQ